MSDIQFARAGATQPPPPTDVPPILVAEGTDRPDGEASHPLELILTEYNQLKSSEKLGKGPYPRWLVKSESDLQLFPKKLRRLIHECMDINAGRNHFDYTHFFKSASEWFIPDINNRNPKIAMRNMVSLAFLLERVWEGAYVDDNPESVQLRRNLAPILQVQLVQYINLFPGLTVRETQDHERTVFISGITVVILTNKFNQLLELQGDTALLTENELVAYFNSLKILQRATPPSIYPQLDLLRSSYALSTISWAVSQPISKNVQVNLAVAAQDELFLDNSTLFDALCSLENAETYIGKLATLLDETTQRVYPYIGTLMHLGKSYHNKSVRDYLQRSVSTRDFNLLYNPSLAVNIMNTVNNIVLLWIHNLEDSTAKSSYRVKKWWLDHFEQLISIGGIALNLYRLQTYLSGSHTRSITTDLVGELDLAMEGIGQEVWGLAEAFAEAHAKKKLQEEA